MSDELDAMVDVMDDDYESDFDSGGDYESFEEDLERSESPEIHGLNRETSIREEGVFDVKPEPEPEAYSAPQSSGDPVLDMPRAEAESLYNQTVGTLQSQWNELQAAAANGRIGEDQYHQLAHQLNGQYNQLQQTALRYEAHQSKRELRLREAHDELSVHIPEWRDPESRDRLQQDLLAWGESMGYSRAELQSISDPRTIRAMASALKATQREKKARRQARFQAQARRQQQNAKANNFGVAKEDQIDQIAKLLMGG